MDNIDRELLNELQSGLPLTERPFAALALSINKTLGLTPKAGKPKSKGPPEGGPFAGVAKQLGISEEETLVRVKSLTADGILRRIGPVLDSRALGRVGTLAAMTVPEEKIDEVAAVVNSFEGVTHNYIRETEGTPAPCNMWFTLHAKNEDELRQILADIERRTSLKAQRFDATKMFKVAVKFEVEADED